MLIIALLISYIMLLIVSYFLFKKDILQPGVIFIAAYVVSVFCAVLNIDKWNINFHTNTFLVLLLGAIEFIAISYIVFKIFNKKYPKEEKQSDLKKEYKPIKTWKIVLISIYCLAAIVLLLYNVLQIAGQFDNYSSLSQALGIFKEHTSYKTDASLPKYINWIQKPMYAFAYIMLYYYIKEVIFNCANIKYVAIKRVYYLIPVICFIIQELLSSNRLSILSLLIGTLIMLGIVWQEKNNWTKNINIKTISIVSVVMIIFLIIFYFSASLVGRKNKKNMVDYITLYAGGSIECFNRFMQDEDRQNNEIIGEESFYYLVKNLYDYNIIEMDEFYPIHLEFRDNDNGETIGNVYTAYRRWTHDFGIGGAFILNGIMAIFYSVFYNILKKQKIKEFAVIMYGYMSYPLFLHCIDGYLYLLTVRIAFITTSAIFVIVYILLNGFNFNKFYNKLKDFKKKNEKVNN